MRAVGIKEASSSRITFTSSLDENTDQLGNRDEIFSHSVYVYIFNLRSCHLRLTLGRALLCIILAMDRTSAQSQVNLSLLRRNSLKFQLRVVAKGGGGGVLLRPPLENFFAWYPVVLKKIIEEESNIYCTSSLYI